jgi:hypothetical protein
LSFRPALPRPAARAVLFVVLAGVAVLATRLPFLAASFDDIDAVNFALAVGDFDPSRHQPHPPGFPVYVLFAKAAAAIAGVEPLGSARTLAALSAVAQALLPLPLFVLFRRLGARPRNAAAATVLTLVNPVVWINGVRPMSDSVGLLLAVTAQALLAGAAARGTGLVAASAVAALAIGARIQIAALTLPVWALAALRPPLRARLIAVAVLVAGVLAWAIPTVVQSGGPAAYWRAFGGTTRDAVDVEPIVFTWTLNRAVRAARFVVFRPWGAEWLGIAMAGLGLLGAVSAWRRGVALRAALVVFVPYVVAHALFQQVHTQRYAMPYVPALALLAVLGMDAMARLGRRPVFAALAIAATAVSAAVGFQGVSAYAAASSPVYAALGEAGRDAPGTVLSGHYMYSRFLALAPPGATILPLPPHQEVPALQAAWLAGETRDVLFLAEPVRTDLESIDPASRTLRGHWAWPPAAARVLSGERPGGVDLVAIRPPQWFAGLGWALSLEMGRGAGAVRAAHLRGRADAGTLILAGEPSDAAAAEWECELSLDGAPIDRRCCASPWLAAYAIPPSASAAYRPLAFTTTRGGVAGTAPFALRALAFGGAGDALLARGDGWHSPETDAGGQPFRWATRVARALVNVPPAGAVLVVEGDVPARVGGAAITLESGDARAAVTAAGRFRVTLDLAPGPPRIVILGSDRDFVPDEVQRNGDRRRLALRVDRFELAAR